MMFAGLSMAQLLGVFGIAGSLVVAFYILKLRRRTVAVPEEIGVTVRREPRDCNAHVTGDNRQQPGMLRRTGCRSAFQGGRFSARVRVLTRATGATPANPATPPPGPGRQTRRPAIFQSRFLHQGPQ